MLDSVFLEICNMSLTASYIILAVIFVRLFFQKAPKIFSYSLWSVVLFRLLCPFTFESAFSIFSITGTATEDIRPFPDTFYTQSNVGTAHEVAIDSLPLQTLETFAETAEPLFNNIFTLIWLIGIAVMVVYSVISLIKLRRKLIGATPLEKNIYIADHIDSPFVMGFIRSKIYLPSNLTDAERAFIISHEQTHIKRLDHITRILAFTSLAVHWFNPLVWIAFVLSGKDMETSCDEAVMKKMNTDIRADYSEALLKFATGKKLIAATPLAFGEGDTKDRVKNVMKYKKPVAWVSAICLVLVGVVAVSLMSNGKAIPQHYKDMYNMRIDVFDENSSQDIEYMVNNFLVYPENVKVTDVESNASEIIIYITTDDKDTFDKDDYWSNVDTLSLLVNSIDVVKHNLNDGESVMSIDVDSGTGFEFDFNDGRDENVFYDMLDEIDEYRKFINSQANSNTLTPTSTQSHSSDENIIDFESIEVDTIQIILAGGNPAYGNKSKTITDPSEVEAFINAFDTFTVKENEETNDAMPSYYRLYDGDKLVEEYMFNGNDSTSMWIGQFVKLVEYEGKSPYELYEQSTAEEVIVYQDSDYTKAADLAKLFIEDNEQNKILDYAQPKVEKVTIQNSLRTYDFDGNELFDIEGQTVYQVTFETEDDDILGPIVCYVDAGSFTVLGIDARR